MMFNAYHNSHSLQYRNPFGAVPCGRRVILRLKTFSRDAITACALRIWNTSFEITIPMKKLYDEQNLELEHFAYSSLYEGQYEVPDKPGLIWYYFIVRADSNTYYYGNNNKWLGGEGSIWNEEPPAYRITVYEQSIVPDWYKRGIIYQLIVDRFYRSNCLLYPRKNALLHYNWDDRPIYIKDELGRISNWDFFGGNLQGIIEKLPYFKELGISILYLNPIFDAPSNHKYDTANYHKIDPMYGDDQVFKQLIDSAKEFGISLILDGVFSHTGSDSIYFNKYGNYPVLGACQSPESQYYTWYKFDAHNEEYKCWWGFDCLPEVDEMNPSYRQFIFGSGESVVNKWLNFGVAGWRLDVADELPDEFIEELRLAIKKNHPEAVIIGEVWEDASNKISYGKMRKYLLGRELDSTTNYPFRDIFLRFVLGIDDSNTVHQRVMSLFENYPHENFYAAMNLIGSHDTVRILTLLGEAPAEERLTNTEIRHFHLSLNARKLAIRRLRLLSLIQMTFPGVPCIYYGDEAGVEGYSDPDNRRTYPWGNQDREIIDWYHRILWINAEYEVLKTGEFRSFFLEPDVYGFLRNGPKEDVVILINRHLEEPKTINLVTWLSKYSFVVDLLTGKALSADSFSALEISALGGRIILGKRTAPDSIRLSRSCGILLHISSLPSVWGIGDLGKEAYEFVDFLVESGQSLWQVLPLNPSGFGDSPYQSESVLAGDPDFISFDLMVKEGLLTLHEIRQKYDEAKSLDINHNLSLKDIKVIKRELLKTAYQSFLIELGSESAKSSYLSSQSFNEFLNQPWLDDYVLYRVLKVHFGNSPWYEWEKEIADRNTKKICEYSALLQNEIGFERFLQYTFFFEWKALKKYANSKGIHLIGDISHFVAADSNDVWVNRSLFVLDEHGKPAKIAGVPPDYFSKTGQLWGNPVYNWQAMSNDNYAWWKTRVRLGLELFDYIRLDHFRGFEAYWEVDAKEQTAEQGQWIKGPGKRFFESLIDTFGKCPFIVEDLGFITTETVVLKQIFGFPGTKVLQFSSLGEASNDWDTNYVFYTGTHDNNTLLGWYEENFSDGESLNGDIFVNKQSKNACIKLIQNLYLSQAAWVILPMQDVLGLPEEARMNIPGTTNGNWQWRMDKNLITDEIKSWLRLIAEESMRC